MIRSNRFQLLYQHLQTIQNRNSYNRHQLDPDLAHSQRCLLFRPFSCFSGPLVRAVVHCLATAEAILPRPLFTSRRTTGGPGYRLFGSVLQFGCRGGMQRELYVRSKKRFGRRIYACWRKRRRSEDCHKKYLQILEVWSDKIKKITLVKFEIYKAIR